MAILAAGTEFREEKGGFEGVHRYSSHRDPRKELIFSTVISS